MSRSDRSRKSPDKILENLSRLNANTKLGFTRSLKFLEKRGFVEINHVGKAWVDVGITRDGRGYLQAKRKINIPRNTNLISKKERNYIKRKTDFELLNYYEL